jgi:hypothetical protein
MSLLDRRRERAAKNAVDDVAAQAEVDRLVALPPKDLAAELIAAFGPKGAASKGRTGTAPMQIIEWLMSSVGRGASTRPLVPAVLAGLQALEHAGLVEARGSGTGSGAKSFLLTPTGETALAEGSTQRYLSS